jgi:ubiquinone/menaquinone biosynthesis C-methylase UbiE
MPDRDWWEALWPDPITVLRQLGIRPGMTVLDLCCGDGYFTAPLAALVQGRVQALDLDPAMLALAQAEVAQRGATVEAWICADARDLPRLLPHPVDHVLMANTFHGVPDQPGLARAVRAVLRPGGLFAIVNWHRVPREDTTVLGQPRGPQTRLRMSPEATAAVIGPAGFRLAWIAEVSPYHYGAVFEARPL